MTHELKCWPEYFQAVKAGRKPFEIRKNDRNYQVGDVLWLREWVPEYKDYHLIGGAYTGDECRVRVTYILGDNGPWLPTGYVAMGVELEPATTEPVRCTHCAQPIAFLQGEWVHFTRPPQPFHWPEPAPPPDPVSATVRELTEARKVVEAAKRMDARLRRRHTIIVGDLSEAQQEETQHIIADLRAALDAYHAAYPKGDEG